MAGAITTSAVGTGYLRTRRTPRVFMTKYLNNWHVCVRRAGLWWEIVAETSDRDLAVGIKQLLKTPARPS
jgi:hypothetical protein